MKWLLVVLLFVAFSGVSAKQCTEAEVKAAVKDVHAVFSKQGKTADSVKYVVDKNKGEFAGKCKGLYVFVNLGVTNVVHVSPKLHGKPLPTLKDKTPKGHGKAKDFFK